MVWKIMIVVRDIDDGAVGEYALPCWRRKLPLIGAVEIVAHEETAAQQILGIFFACSIGEIPLAHLAA